MYKPHSQAFFACCKQQKRGGGGGGGGRNETTKTPLFMALYYHFLMFRGVLIEWLCYSLVPRLISQAFIACSMKSNKSLGDKAGNEASSAYTTEFHSSILAGVEYL